MIICKNCGRELGEDTDKDDLPEPVEASRESEPFENTRVVAGFQCPECGTITVP